MTAEQAMKKLNEWQKKYCLEVHTNPAGWWIEAAVEGGFKSGYWTSDFHPTLTDAVAEIAAKMEKDGM